MINACSEKKENTMIINGEIKSLKKGTVYLQKMKDTILISVDSVALDGINTFSLTDQVESPEIYYISLKDAPGKEISFFGEKGVTSIKTKLDKFNFGATIIGQTNQQLLEKFNEMDRKFRDKRLDLVKSDFDAKKSGDSTLIDSIGKVIKNLIKRRYYYTTNFAVTHADKEIAPYLALKELYNANIALLDTIDQTLTPKIKASKYGQQLNKFITSIKKNEQ
jgi:hypothetical protein